MSGKCKGSCLRFAADGLAHGAAGARVTRSHRRAPSRVVHRWSLHRLARLVAQAAWCGTLAACATSPPYPLDGAGSNYVMAVIPATVHPAAGPNVTVSGPTLAKGVRDAKEAAAVAGGAAGVAIAVLGVVGMAICPFCAAGLAPMVGQGLGLAGAAAVSGLGGGADTGIPAAQQVRVARVLGDAGAALNLQRLAADGVVESIARFAPFRAEVVEAAQAVAATGVPAHRALRERGHGSALEIGVTRFGLAATNAQRFSLFVTMEARLLDTGSGKATWMRGMIYESAAHDLERWLRDGAELTRVELGRGTRVLAERTVDLLVLRTPWLDERDELSCGVPVLDPQGNSAGAPPEMGPPPPAATVQSRTPLLAWEPLPRMHWKSAPASWEMIGDRRYDLRVWKVAADAPGDIVYERLGLTGTRHQVEVALDPASMYFWSVRLRGTVDGRPQAASWSAWKLPRVPTQPFLGEARITGAYRLSDTLTPVVIEERSGSCPTLDYIPAGNFHRFLTP